MTLRPNAPQIAVGLLTGTISLAGCASPNSMDNAGMSEVKPASQTQHSEGSCGEGRCGSNAKSNQEASCGEGKCGSGEAKDKTKEASCGEGKCGSGGKDTEAKCGEGKCGA